MKRVLWVGLAHVSSADDADQEGGFVHALGVAEYPEAFEADVREALLDLGFELVELTDVSTVLEQYDADRLGPELTRLA